MRLFGAPRSTVVLAALALIGAVVVATVVAVRNHDQASADPLTEHPFDPIPGLGVTVAAAQRDEVISYWEAWRRDTAVRDCMQAAGFEWFPEVLYPAEATLQVAAALDVTPATVFDPAPEFLNAEIRSSLSASERDRYDQTLYGESSADLDYVEEHDGQLPEGADPETFARGGCTGLAGETVGSIWDLERSLADDLDALRQSARETYAFQAGVTQYSQCASDHGLTGIQSPADLDARAEIATLAEELSVIESVLAACESLWEQANWAGLAEVADQFWTERAAVLQPHMAKYEDALDRIIYGGDWYEFRDFLSAAAGRALEALAAGY